MALIQKQSVWAAALALFFCGMWAILWSGRSAAVAALAGAVRTPEPVVVIDAGHGGEDGGAVAADGTLESGLNLEVARRTELLLRFCGKKTAMTRREDQSLNTEGGSLRERKASDLRFRADTVNAAGNAILLSIHQNTLPGMPSVHGAQVFYNREEGAAALAEGVQASLNAAVNPGNAKKTKEISPSIYLMSHVTAPAILVECGFLSSPAETAELKKPAYQLRLAASVTAGILRCGTPAGKE